MTHAVLSAIATAALARQLDPALVTALVEQESGGNPFAFRPEPKYAWLWDVRARKPFRRISADEALSKYPPKDFRSVAGTDPTQEWTLQQASIGLCQLMGAVAREEGFGEPYLLGLVVPETNLHYGCLHFAGLLAWAHGDVAKALAGWNGGRAGYRGTQARLYAASVLARMKVAP